MGPDLTYVWIFLLETEHMSQHVSTSVVELHNSARFVLLISFHDSGSDSIFHARRCIFMALASGRVQSHRDCRIEHVHGYVHVHGVVRGHVYVLAHFHLRVRAHQGVHVNVLQQKQ